MMGGDGLIEEIGNADNMTEEEFEQMQRALAASMG